MRPARIFLNRGANLRKPPRFAGRARSFQCTFSTLCPLFVHSFQFIRYWWAVGCRPASGFSSKWKSTARSVFFRIRFCICRPSIPNVGCPDFEGVNCAICPKPACRQGTYGAAAALIGRFFDNSFRIHGRISIVQIEFSVENLDGTYLSGLPEKLNKWDAWREM